MYGLIQGMNVNKLFKFSVKTERETLIPIIVVLVVV